MLLARQRNVGNNVARQSINVTATETVHRQHDAENRVDVDGGAERRPAARHGLSDECRRLRPATFVLPLGSHLVTPRRGYVHHGIYSGDGKVVHYAGLMRSPPFGCVEEVPFEQFSCGHDVFVVTTPTPRFPADEIVRRAHSRLGEARYNLLSNNCEHLCAWCLVGASYSEQVERLRAWLERLDGVAQMVAGPWRRLPPRQRLDATVPQGCSAQLRNALIADKNSHCA
jgi:hypothetical protein